jgi:DNA-binding response OmpR family regulator
MLRIDAMMKRVKRTGASSSGVSQPNVVIELDNGGLRADITARVVYIDGARIEMSPKEYDLFFYLLSNKNIALSREKLLNLVWEYDYEGDIRTVDAHIQRLRQKLGISDRIQTVYKTGYRFEV